MILIIFEDVKFVQPPSWIFSNRVRVQPLFVFLGWIFLIFHPLKVNSLQFSPFEGVFFAFFTFLVWIVCNFYLYRENSLPFLSFQDEFFAIFNLQGWILCIFQPLRVNFLYFFPLKVNSLHFLALRLNSLQFLPFNDEFFAIFTLQGWNLFNFYLL